MHDTTIGPKGHQSATLKLNFNWDPPLWNRHSKNYNMRRNNANLLTIVCFATKRKREARPTPALIASCHVVAYVMANYLLFSKLRKALQRRAQHRHKVAVAHIVHGKGKGGKILQS